MNRIILIALLMACCCSAFAKEYFVGGTGASDNNPGTTAQPFATIQKAASVAVAGDVIKIRSGTYRETIVPANSGTSGNPIVYQPDGNSVVIISGTNQADGGWTLHSGNIYKKSLTLPVNGYQKALTSNTTILANQVFKDGVMMFEARWPKLNIPADLLDRTKLRKRSSTSTFNDNTLTDTGLPGGLAGARINILGWFLAYTRTITNHSGSSISYSTSPGGEKFKQYYYVTGKLNLLTQAKEWHYESGTLYFFQEGGGSPTGVEYKARNWGFDLRGKSGITLSRLQFHGCEPMTGNTASTYTVLDGIKSKYQNHSFLQEDPDVIYSNAKQTGIKLIGANSVIRNSEIQFAASQGIWLGANCKAENNLITDISYEGNYGAGITLWDNDAGQIITKNTMHRFGRSAIDFGYNEYGAHLNFNINMNDIYHFGMLNVDLGGIYGARRINTTGSRIHHNWVHDSKATDDPSVLQIGINTGIYFDQAVGPVTVDHNVLWNNVQADFYNQQVYGRTAGGSLLYNNTFATDAGDTHPNHHSYVTYVTTPPDIQRNNIYRDDINISWGSGVRNVANVLLEGVNPQFNGTGAAGLAFRLKAGSPAINAGVALPGITDGSIGNPDIGAYEYGGSDWVPGYVATTPTVPPVSVPVTAVSIAPTNVTILVGGSSQLSRTILPASATSQNVSWTTSNPSVATVSSTGLVAAVSTGSATITATTQDGSFKATSAIAVNANSTPVQSISMSPTTSTLTIGGNSTVQLIKTVNPAAATNQNVLYTTSNAGVATVNAAGLVTAVSVGNAAITATTQEGAFTGTCVISVNANSTGIIDDAVRGTGTNQHNYSGTGWVNATAVPTPLNKTISYSNVTNNSVTLSFVGTKVEWYNEKLNTHGIAAVSVDNGPEVFIDLYSATLVTQTLVYASPALAQGNHTFKIRVTGTKNPAATGVYIVHDFLKVYSGSVAVQGVTVAPTTSTLTIGGNTTLQLTKTVSPAAATNQNVLYTTSNPGVATVNAGGVVTAVGVGNATITATTQEGSFTGTCAISVNANTTSIIDDAIRGTGNNQHQYSGTGWVNATGVPTPMNNTISFSNVTNNAVTLSFVGNKIEWYNEKLNTHGIAAVSIDNGPEVLIDLYSATPARQLLIYSSQNLVQGSHTFKIRVTGTKNPSSTGVYVVHDFLKVYSSAGGSGGGGERTVLLEEPEAEMDVYPNPLKSGDILYLEVPHAPGKLQISDMMGKSKYDLQVTETKLEIPTAHLTSGMYLLYYKSAKGLKSTKILIK